MASNGVAANLLMLAILAAGLVSLTGLEREAWSAINFYTVEVSMAYPGANPEEIEESIVIKIEDQVSGLEDVNTVRSVAAPGIASVRVEMNSGVDMAQALNDVESAVARIQTFPTGAERPEIREMTSGHSIIRLILYGDMAERSLKELAHQIEDEFTALPEVSLPWTISRISFAPIRWTFPPEASIPQRPRCACGPWVSAMCNRNSRTSWSWPRTMEPCCGSAISPRSATSFRR